VSEVEEFEKTQTLRSRSGPGLVRQKNTQQMIDFGDFLRLE